MTEFALREAVIQAACALHRDSLTIANSGNVSVRYQDQVLITPSGVAYEDLQPEDIVAITLEGELVAAHPYKPSSEWRFHCDIYRHRSEVNAIVHAHSPSATALSTLRLPVPPFHYMVALMGSSHIPCAEYATFGTQALSDNVLAAMEGHVGCLMANHGMLTVGENLSKAYRLALELESLCAQYSEAKQLGQIHLLTEGEIEEARQAFSGYGQ